MSADETDPSKSAGPAPQPPFRRTPPKNAEAIRSSLSAIRNESQLDRAPGPRREGLSEHDEIVVGSFGDPEQCQEVQQRLLDEGIFSSILSQRGTFQVAVDVASNERAVQLVKQYQTTRRKRRRRLLDGRFDGVILGIVSGGTLGLIVALMLKVSGPSGMLTMLVLVVGWGTLGATLGAAFDATRRYRHQAPWRQFAIVHVFLLIAAIAMALGLLAFLRSEIRVPPRPAPPPAIPPPIVMMSNMDFQQAAVARRLASPLQIGYRDG